MSWTSREPPVSTPLGSVVPVGAVAPGTASTPEARFRTAAGVWLGRWHARLLAVKVRLRNPERELEVPGPALVSVVLERLGINRESVLVIRDGTIVPGDERVEDDEAIEVRPVISGGAG